MSHARQQICDEVVAILGLSPTTWKAVFGTRLPAVRAVMPFLMVFADSEPTTPVTDNAPLIYQRDMNLIVAGRLRLPGNNDAETVEQAMNDLAEEVETTLTFSALQTRLAQVQRLWLVTTEMVVVQTEDGQPQYAEVTLSFVVRYFTQEGAPGTLL